MAWRESELTGCCGLYCGDCIRFRSRAAALAGDLSEELRRTRFQEYAALKSGAAPQFDTVATFRHYGIFLEVLKAINALKCESPCRTGDGCPSFACEILACCRQKGLEGCWECQAFEACDKFEPLQSIHGDSPRRNLKKIKEMGLENWAQYRERPYIWQQ